MHAGINDAALRLAAMNRIHAIGCMVGGASWAGSSAVLRHLDSGGVDIGLHLDLTENPLLDGSRRPLREWVVDSFLRRLDRGSVRAEIRAQLDCFEQALGHGPAFVDGHQHVHQFQTVRTELLAELQARYAGFPPWIRSTRTPRSSLRRLHSSRSEVIKPWGIERLGCGALASLARVQGCPQNRHLLGVYDFLGGSERYRELLAGWLLSAADGDLLMCHPSLPSHQTDVLIQARCAEFAVLSGTDFDLQLRDADLQLGPMSQILARVSGD